MTKQLQERRLIINEALEEYDGTTAVVQSEHLSAEEIEFLRWRAERWIKTLHLPAVFLHSPGFLLWNVFKILRHTFRGSTVRSALGLEVERRAFERYRAIRKQERAYI